MVQQEQFMQATQGATAVAVPNPFEQFNYQDNVRNFGDCAISAARSAARNKIAVGAAILVSAFGAKATFFEGVAQGEDGPTVGVTAPTGPTATPPSTPSSSSTNPNACPTFAIPTGPCDMGIDVSRLSNLDVKGCQDSAIGTQNDPKDPGMIYSRAIRYKVGSKKITVDEKIYGLERWIGPKYRYSCRLVTNNSVDQRMVRRKVSKSNNKNVAYKSLSKRNTIKGNQTVTFDPSHVSTGGSLSVRKQFTLPRKLTRQDVKKRNVCLKEVTSSVPLIQKPYTDPDHNNPDLPGPMTTQYRTDMTCIGNKGVSKKK